MSDAAPPSPSNPPGDSTSVHLQNARHGDRESLGWILARFSPLLLAQAEYRLRGRLRHVCDPEDLVNEVWVRVLPRLLTLSAEGPAANPQFLKYLSTALLRRVRDLAEKHIVGKPRTQAWRPDDSERNPLQESLAAEVSGVVTRVARKEVSAEVHDALKVLSPRQREIVILRGIEQNPNQEVAVVLGMSANGVAVAYRRARDLLAKHLPPELQDALG